VLKGGCKMGQCIFLSQCNFLQIFMYLHVIKIPQNQQYAKFVIKLKYSIQIRRHLFKNIIMYMHQIYNNDILKLKNDFLSMFFIHAFLCMVFTWDIL